MFQTIVKKKNKFSFTPSKIKEIFDLSLHLSKLTEELLEENALYSKEFLKGLERSETDVKEGRVNQINSLQELF